MALPGDLTTFTLTLGAYTDAAGTVMLVGATAKLFPVDPATGKRLHLVHVATGAEIIPADITVTIGAGGTATVGPLPHTDNAGLSTIGFAYKVEWQVASGRRRSAPDDKMFAVPAAAGASVDYDLLDVAEAVPGVLVPMQTTPSGGAGGALSGTYPNPGLNEVAVDALVAGAVADTASDTYAALNSGFTTATELTAGLATKPDPQAVTTTKTAAYTAAANEIVVVDPTGRTLIDAVANTTATMTSASGEFTAADVGKVISGHFIPLGTTILSFQSANSVTLSAATTGNVNGANASRKVNLEGSTPVTLPASAPAGTVIEVKSMGWGTGVATVKPSGSDNIDGLTQVSWVGYRVSRRFVKGVGTTWTVAGGLTPINGPHSAKYLHGYDLYMPSDSCLKRAKQAIGAAKHNGVPMKMLQKGDSTTYGVIGGGGNNTSPVYNPAALTLSKDINAGERMRKRLNATNALNGRVDSVYAGPTMDWGMAGSRFTLGGGLTSTMSFTSVGHTLTMVDDQQANAWDVVVQRLTGAPAGVTYTIDGGSSTALDLSSLATNNATGTFRITAGGLGTHTVVFNGPTSGQYAIQAITPVQTATPAVIQVRNGGYSGQTLATAISGASTGTNGQTWAEVTIWRPQLVRLLMGINDLHTWSSGNGTPAAGAAAYKTSLTSFVTLCKGVGADVILGVWPSYVYALQNIGAFEAYLYHQAIYEVADTYDCAVWDLQRRWGYGSASSDYSNLAWPMYDGVHPTLAGYEDMAIAEANILSLVA